MLNLADYIKEVITSVGSVASDVGTLQTDVTALQALPYPSNALYLGMFGFSDFSVGASSTRNGTKLEGNKLTIKGGSSSYYYHTFLFGTHRTARQTSQFEEFLPSDFIPISWFFTASAVLGHKRKYCLRSERATPPQSAGTEGSADYFFKIALMKDNGDGTYTYKSTASVGSRMNFQFTGGDLDLTQWDGITIAVFSNGCSVPTINYFFIEEGEGLTYGLDQ